MKLVTAMPRHHWITADTAMQCCMISGFCPYTWWAQLAPSERWDKFFLEGVNQK